MSFFFSPLVFPLSSCSSWALSDLLWLLNSAEISSVLNCTDERTDLAFRFPSLNQRMPGSGTVSCHCCCPGFGLGQVRAVGSPWGGAQSRVLSPPSTLDRRLQLQLPPHQPRGAPQVLEEHEKAHREPWSPGAGVPGQGGGIQSEGGWN